MSQVKNTLNIINNKDVQMYLKQFDMSVQNVSWEDISRNKNSSFGNNITDMTLCMQDDYSNPDKKSKVLCPIIRHANFNDKTFDVPVDTFNVFDSDEKKVLKLSDYLKKLDVYDPRDEQGVILQTQCCILPVISNKKTNFCVSLYNYTANSRSPSTLAICSIKNSTSSILLKHKPTKLYQSVNNIPHWFNLERLADVRSNISGKQEERVTDFKQMSESEKQENCIMIVQVPLIQNKVHRVYGGSKLNDLDEGEWYLCSINDDEVGNSAYLSNAGESFQFKEKNVRHTNYKEKGLDMGNVQTGSVVDIEDRMHDNEFVTQKNNNMKRDPKYPVRVTFQYYRAADNNNIPNDELDNIVQQLLQPFKVATAFGSLVTNDTTNRPTESVSKDKKNIPEYSLAKF